MPTSGMSCEVFTPEPQRYQNSPPPFSGAGKNKGAFAQGHVLKPVRLTLSTVRWDARTSRHRSLFRFLLLTSFSTARVSVSCLTLTLFPTHNSIISTYFYLHIVCPIKPIPDHYHFIQLALLIISTAHHHTRNLPFLFLKKDF